MIPSRAALVLFVLAGAGCAGGRPADRDAEAGLAERRPPVVGVDAGQPPASSVPARTVEGPIERGEASFTGDVLTDVRDVRACLPLEGGSVLAATGGGLLLVRPDGTTRAPWTALDGLPETRVHALLREGDRVWVGTEGGLAAARVQGEALSIDRAWPGKPVRALARHGGSLFAATWGGGVVQVDERKSRLVEIRGAERRFSALAEHEGALFAGSAGGLFRVDERRIAPVASASASIWALAVHEGRLWIGSLTGLSSMAGGVIRNESGADVRALAPAGDALLAGTFGQGVLAVRGGKVEAVAGLGATSFVQALGALGDTRCAGAPDGLFVQRGAGARWETPRVPDLASNDLSAIARDGERLWIGTFDRGLAFLDGSRVTRLRHPAIDDKVNGIAVEARAEGSRVWVATARGLALVEGRSTAGVPSAVPQVTRYGELDGLPSGDVHAVAALSTGGVLVGTARGAAIVREGVVTVLGEKRGIPPGAVWAVAEGPRATLLLGTSRGLLVGTAESRGVLDRGAPVADGGRPPMAPAAGAPEVEADGGPKPTPWLLLSMASGDLEDDWVTALAARGKTLYVGTYNAGVTAVTMDGVGFAVEQLGGGYVNFGGLLVQGRTLFAATMNGLLVRPASGEGEWKTARRATTGRDVTAIAPAGPGGRLWVASRRGLARFDPG